MRQKNVSLALAAAGVLALAAGSASATWSIVIVDTRTGEVAAGSATCLTNINLKDETPVIVLGRGAATAQALLEQTGVTRSDLRQGLLHGDHPDSILQTLADNDTGHKNRQYGLVDVRGRAMTFSGSSANNWAGGVLGRIERGAPGPADDIVYAIQGNILTGEGVVLAAEQAILASPGDVADMLMDAMWAARITGGDGRCSCDAGPTDCGTPPGNPEEFKSADVGYMIVGRLGDIDASRALYRFFEYSTLQAFDLTGDGREELLAFAPFSGAVQTYAYLEESVPGVLAIEQTDTINWPIQGVRNSVVGDVTGDGIDDLMLISGIGGSVWLVRGLENGTIKESTPIRIEGLTGIDNLTLLNLDGLGGLDAVAIKESNGAVIPIFGGASSTLTIGSAVSVPGVRGPARIGDLDNDTDHDMALINDTTGSVQLILNNGDGTLTLGSALATTFPATDAAIVDLDKDGLGEILTTEPGSNQTAVYAADGTPSQRIRTGFNPSRFVLGDFVPGAPGELVVVSSRKLNVVGLDGLGGITLLSSEGTGTTLDRSIAIDLSGDGLDEIVGGEFDPTNPPRLMLVDNQNGMLDEPRGWGAGRYFLTLNVANTASSDPDPVETLQGKFDRWRDNRAGTVDAVYSTIEGGAQPLGPGRTAVYTVTLQAYPGVPITSDPIITATTTDDSVARVLSVETQPDGTVLVTVEGVSGGSASLHVLADDFGNRPIVLMPSPTIEVVANPADFNGDGIVSQADLKAFIQAFVSGDPAADIDSDGVVGMGDVAAFIQSFLEATGRGRGRFKH